MTGLPFHISTRAYDAAWGEPDADRAEGDYLAVQWFKHGIAFVAALESAEFGDGGLNDLCTELAHLIETRWADIKRRGDL